MSGPVNKFEDLQVWQEGMTLAVSVYESLKQCRDFGFRDQIQRAAVSVPSNISEGYERNSNKEFIQFLYFAKGSAGEVRTQLHLAKRVRMIDSTKAEELLERSRKVSAMLARLIAARKERFN